MAYTWSGIRKNHICLEAKALIDISQPSPYEPNRAKPYTKGNSRIMSHRTFISCFFLLALAGCASNNSMPRIVHSTVKDNPEPVVRRVIKPKPAPKIVQENFPPGWVPPSDVEKKWTAVVIHHSATENGNAAIFDRMHREENHWDGIGYDFVIGNGTDSQDGQIEVTFRWRKQIAGAHCGGTPGNWANVDAVGICLVGNFDYTTPTANQMQSLAKLVKFLQKRYDISKTRIYGHNNTPGGRVTECPGSRFSIESFKDMLGS